MSSVSCGPLRVAELFAGVGGFRLGLEGWSGGSPAANGQYKVVFSKQWEPSTGVQHASDVYVARWGAEGHYNENIFGIASDPGKFSLLAATRPDVLVGGFPCQDYSVASTNARGIEGKKGVLWWAIYDVLRQLDDAGHPVRHLILENVDRLLKSPTGRRGADFAVILASLAGLDYAVEWRVVNAADYGFAQRRRRVYIVAHHRSTPLAQEMKVSCRSRRAGDWMAKDGVLAEALEADAPDAAPTEVHIGSNVLRAQAAFSRNARRPSPFRTAGVMVEGDVWTVDLKPSSELSFARYTGVDEPLTLGDVVEATGPVPRSFYLAPDSLPRWQYLKGAKREARTKSDGFSYEYSEGAVAFPDDLSRPSRTVITSEGGAAPSRTKHVVRDGTGGLRRLTPEEVEALNGFPRGFTRVDGVSDAKRAFMMGNALVVGLVAVIGDALAPRARARRRDSAAA